MRKKRSKIDMKSLANLLLLLSLCFACSQDSEETLYSYDLAIPMGFPKPDIPENNELNADRIHLGKLLFFDPVLSRDSTISCGTCHKQEFAFADNLPTTPGIEDRPGTRNVTSLTNVAYQDLLLREGSIPTIEQQILAPVQEHNEFDFNFTGILKRLKKDSVYTQLARKTYDRTIDPFVITRAIAAFERTMISGNSPYDQFVFQGKTNAPLSKRFIRWISRSCFYSQI